MVSSVLCRCVASPPPDAAATASSSASSPASVDPCGGAVCGGPDHQLRLWSLFQTLDVNRDGGLCVNDLAVGLRRLGLHRTEGELQVGNELCPRGRGGDSLRSPAPSGGPGDRSGLHHRLLGQSLGAWLSWWMTSRVGWDPLGDRWHPIFWWEWSSFLTSVGSWARRKGSSWLQVGTLWTF